MFRWSSDRFKFQSKFESLQLNCQSRRQSLECKKSMIAPLGSASALLWRVYGQAKNGTNPS